MSMVFGIGRRDAQDTDEPQQPARVPYKLASYEHDHEGQRMRNSKVVYSFWSAAKYVLILSIILWWLPMFGQMIAGYVGGRRAGGPWRGVAAAILPVFCLYIIISGFDSGFFPSHLFGVAIAPAAISTALSEGVPFISPYIHFSSEYLGSFVNALAGASPYGINTYVLTVAFAYVGGILAEQSRREIEFNSGAMMSNTTVLVSDNSGGQLPAQSPYTNHHGFAHMVASMFPWGHGHEQANGANVMHAVHSSDRAWSQAIPMRYESRSQGPGYPRALPPADAQGEVATFSSAKTKRKQPRKQRRLKSNGDPWQRADRRVTQHYSSGRRLKPVEPSSEVHAHHRRSNPASHRGKVPTIVPGDERSVRRARKAIDMDWGRSGRNAHFQQPVRAHAQMHARNSQPVIDDEDVPDPSENRHRAPRPPQNHWDTI
jgi:hypothetical protein